MLALLVPIIGGPECGDWAEVLWCGHGVVVYHGHRYVWEAEDDGSRYLRYVGEAA